MLYKYTGQEDIAVGTPIANRSQSEITSLVGFFTNVIVLRTALESKASFQELLSQVKETALDAYAHQDVPFEKVVDTLEVSRDRSRSPLFQTMFVLQDNEAIENLEVENILIKPLPVQSGTTKFELTLSATKSDNGFAFQMEYATDLFKEETIRRMSSHFVNLLKAIVKAPESSIADLNILDKREVQQLLVNFNDTKVKYPENETIISVFSEQAAQTPDAIALVFKEKQLTYRQLETQSNQLSHYLQQQGVTTETLVPICVNRSLEMIVGILGILKAGGIYVPIDPDYPKQRINFMLQDIDTKLILTQSYLSHLFDNEKIKTLFLDELSLEEMSSQVLEEVIQAEQLCYVIYTSGTTGNPKGVAMEHQSILNLIHSQRATYRFQSEEISVLISNYVFDASLEQILLPLFYGGTLLMITKEDLLDHKKLEEIIISEKVTHLHGTPSLLETINVARAYPYLKRVVSGGESCSLDLRDSWLGKCDFFNDYGPTETNASHTYECHSSDDLHKIPIGLTLPNMQSYILDQHLQPVPIGVIGELYISGAGLSRGYFNRPELTAEKFIANPFLTGERMYKTGDLTRWLPDGNVEFIGRRDHQVKIRGYRIELGEIESVLNRLKEVQQALVLVLENQQGNKQLVAYLVLAEAVENSAIQKVLSAQLPDYMVPRIYMQLDRFPLNTNGKIDRKALPHPDRSAYQIEEYVAPTNETEKKMVAIWQELLGVDKIGIHDDFFEIGGHSLLATQLNFKIKQAFKYELKIIHIFQNPTISLLSEQIRNRIKFIKHAGLIKLNEKMSNQNTNLFAVPGSGGFAEVFYELSNLLQQDYNIYGLQSYGLDQETPLVNSIEEIAASNILKMQKIDAVGPYSLMGYSMGGMVVYEMSLQLIEQGYKVKELILLDSLFKSNHNAKEQLNFTDIFLPMVNIMFSKFSLKPFSMSKENLILMDKQAQIQSVWNELISDGKFGQIMAKEQFDLFIENLFNNVKIAEQYKPKNAMINNLSITFFKTKNTNESTLKDWQQITNKEVKIFNTDGNHYTILGLPYVENIAEALMVEKVIV